MIDVILMTSNLHVIIKLYKYSLFVSLLTSFLIDALTIFICLLISEIWVIYLFLLNKYIRHVVIVVIVAIFHSNARMYYVL